MRGEQCLISIIKRWDNMFSKSLLSLIILTSLNLRITLAATQILAVNDEIVSLANDISLLDETKGNQNAAITQNALTNKEEAENSLILQALLQTLDKKLSTLEETVKAQDQFGRKLIALEFTLNHVLSKVVYLSEHFQINSNIINNSNESQTANSSNAKESQTEILNHLTQLLRHVQNIERDNCRRISIPAAAGPVISNKAEQPLKPHRGNVEFDSQNFNRIEESLRKLELRLNVLSKFTNLASELRQMPSLIKQNGVQLTRVLEYVGQCYNENSQQQGLQQMLEYCQGISEEFSTFSGSSDALLKHIESIVQDTKKSVANLGLNGIVNKHKDQQPCSHQNKSFKNMTATEVGKNHTKDSNDIIKPTVGNEQYKVIPAPAKNGCHDLENGRDVDGIYAFGLIDANKYGRDFNQRFCTFATDERAWTVIQRRGPYEEQENFNRSWVDYRSGFGDLNKDFWFGNEFIHRLTYLNNYELLIELESHEGSKMSISYGNFGLDSEQVNYNLFVSDYKGPGPDSLSYHNFMDFSTFDRRNDKSIDACCPCAIGYGSGWWFDNCLEANLNGVYQLTPIDHSYVGIIWEHWLGDYSLKAARMLIRPKNFLNDTFGDP